MQDKVERWMEVCALAAKEQDPKKLMELTNEVLRLLDEGRGKLINRLGPLDVQASSPLENSPDRGTLSLSSGRLEPAAVSAAELRSRQR